MTSGAERCAKCFQPLEPNARFCGRCGTEVKAPARSTDSAPSHEVSGVECLSCHHRNDPTARFCERCGTQLRSSSQGSYRPPASESSRGYLSNAQSEDPWATGPGYERPHREDQECPRCGTFRNPEDSACSQCGLPFGQQTNYAGVPPAVARQGNPAGFWIRFVAAIVDGIIVGVISAIMTAASIAIDGGAATTIDVIQFAFNILYGPVLLSMYGTTPGKKLFNIYIYDHSGKKPGFGRAFIREIAKFVSAFILFIGYIMAAFREDKRALHDLIAGTYPTQR